MRIVIERKRIYAYVYLFNFIECVQFHRNENALIQRHMHMREWNNYYVWTCVAFFPSHFFPCCCCGTFYFTSIQIVMLVWTFTLIPHNCLFLFHVIRLPLFSICWWCGASSAFLLNGCCRCLYFFHSLTHVIIIKNVIIITR